VVRLTLITKGHRLLLCVVALAAAGMVACEDPIPPGVRQPTFALQIEVFALTGGPINSPSAIRLASGSAVRSEGLVFDVAFDIQSDERVTLYPVRLVASPAVGGHRVGMQTSTTTYTDLIEAPRTGYVYDSLLVVAPGQTVIIESSDPNMCGFSYVGTTFYGKLVVDSLNQVSRQIWSRLTVNPNCGSRSLAPGTPRD
jgi:hypothetical protein